MSKKSRKQTVLQVLRRVKDAQHDQNRLIVEVWKSEGCRTLDDVFRFGSSASGILRDRRRTDVLEEFPRDEEKEEHFRNYREEFSKIGLIEEQPQHVQDGLLGLTQTYRTMEPR